MGGEAEAKGPRRTGLRRRLGVEGAPKPLVVAIERPTLEGSRGEQDMAYQERFVETSGLGVEAIYI